jgi:hypothetical protein
MLPTNSIDAGLLNSKNITTWGRCPVRFVVDEQGELLSMIQQQLIEYYVSKEFKERNESKETRPQRKLRKKHVPA